MDSFSSQLRKLLTAKQWNQVRAAGELGVTQSQISDYLSGKSEPYLSTAVAAAKRLGVSLDELSGLRSSRSVVREGIAAYGRDEPFNEWAERLKRQWRRKGASRAKMELAIRVLFPDDADRVIQWLNAQR
ncbi:MAG: helix-turn-helix transcriptional regulator [Verrucomicrobiia bacterium]|jgi:transcriptional regulator with XRE-family HTH domain